MSTLAARLAATRLRRQQFPDGTVAATPRGGFAWLYGRVREWRRAARARAELARMSIRDLQDIGITPAERDHECDKRLWWF